MDRASQVIVIAFLGAAALLVVFLWVLVRLDRSAARATTPAARPTPAAPPAAAPAAPPAPAPVLPPPVLVVVEDPPVEPEPATPILPNPPVAPVASGEPVPDPSSRVVVGAAAGVAAFLAILVLLIGTHRRRHPRS